MKQTFNIPDGCKVVTVEQIGNQLITSFEPEKYVPKVGDFVKIIYPSGNKYFCEVSDVEGDIIVSRNVEITKDGVHFKIYPVYITYDSIEKITPEEFQAEFEKHGYEYDFDTKTAKKKRKRFENGERYFFSDQFFEPNNYREAFDYIDDRYYESGNYFETEAECQKYCDYMKECSLKYFEK